MIGGPRSNCKLRSHSALEGRDFDGGLAMASALQKVEPCPKRQMSSGSHVFSTPRIAGLSSICAMKVRRQYMSPHHLSPSTPTRDLFTHPDVISWGCRREARKLDMDMEAQMLSSVVPYICWAFRCQSYRPADFEISKTCRS